MINPRVTNFKSAPLNLSYKNGNISNDGDIMKIINHHYYNFSVSLVFADSMVVPINIDEILTLDSSYYRIKSVPLHLLISQDFIRYFIKSGELTGVSSNKWLDSDNTIAITPDGFLVLSVDSIQYQQLGLINGPAINIRKNINSYLVFINLKKECFQIGHKNYEKAYENLLTKSMLKFDLILTWEPKEEKVCPSSIAKFFSRHGLQVSEHNIERSKRISYNVKFPLFSAPEEDLFEWFGAFLIDINESQSESLEGNEFGVFDVPEPYENISQVVLASWTGLLTRKRVLQFYQELKKLSYLDKEVPWIGISVLGYLDTPVCWGLKPHSFRSSGENDYSILLNPEGRYIMCKNVETLSVR